MNRMRRSLIYPACYLTGAGLGMTITPQLLLRTMFSNGHYDSPAIRFAGVFVIGLALIVIQTIRHDITAIYPTLIGVRVVFCAGYVALFAQTGDPFFLVVLAIVGAGLVASCISFARDRRDPAACASGPH